MPRIFAYFKVFAPCQFVSAVRFVVQTFFWHSLNTVAKSTFVEVTMQRTSTTTAPYRVLRNSHSGQPLPLLPLSPSIWNKSARRIAAPGRRSHFRAIPTAAILQGYRIPLLPLVSSLSSLPSTPIRQTRTTSRAPRHLGPRKLRNLTSDVFATFDFFETRTSPQRSGPRNSFTCESECKSLISVD